MCCIYEVALVPDISEFDLSLPCGRHLHGEEAGQAGVAWGGGGGGGSGGEEAQQGRDDGSEWEDWYQAGGQGPQW